MGKKITLDEDTFVKLLDQRFNDGYIAGRTKEICSDHKHKFILERLNKTGFSHAGLCPFHEEQTGSLIYNAKHRVFKCYGCQEEGDHEKLYDKLKELLSKN